MCTIWWRSNSLQLFFVYSICRDGALIDIICVLCNVDHHSVRKYLLQTCTIIMNCTCTCINNISIYSYCLHACTCGSMYVFRMHFACLQDPIVYLTRCLTAVQRDFGVISSILESGCLQTIYAWLSKINFFFGCFSCIRIQIRYTSTYFFLSVRKRF